MRVLVCGGRKYGDVRLVNNVLDELHRAYNITLIIHGTAKGPDTFARYWAIRNGVDVKGYRPDWSRLGPKAGPLRNQRMLDEGKPELVVAFPGGNGTADMVWRTRQAGIRLKTYPMTEDANA